MPLFTCMEKDKNALNLISCSHSCIYAKDHIYHKCFDIVFIITD